MLKKGLILQIMNKTNHCQKEKNKKWINESSINWKNHERICWIKSKNCNGKDDGNEGKKAKGTKCVIERKLKFENYKNFLEEATQLENKINYLEKGEIKADSLKKEKIIKNNKLKLKTQQRFKSERHNLFTWRNQ